MRLGRTYPQPILDRISKAASQIDGLSSGSVVPTLEQGADVSRQASVLNARLVNEVMIVSGQVTDEEASARISQVEKGIQETRSQEAKARLLETASAVVFQPAQAEMLVSQWDRALLVYRDAADRLSRFKAAFEGYQDLVSDLEVLDRDAVWNEGAVDQFQELSEGGAQVEMDPSTFRRISSWIGQVLVLDNRERRMEAQAERRPARPVPSLYKVSPWISIAAVTAGLGGIGMVFWYSIRE